MTLSARVSLRSRRMRALHSSNQTRRTHSRVCSYGTRAYIPLSNRSPFIRSLIHLLSRITFSLSRSFSPPLLISRASIMCVYSIPFDPQLASSPGRTSDARAPSASPLFKPRLRAWRRRLSVQVRALYIMYTPAKVTPRVRAPARLDVRVAGRAVWINIVLFSSLLFLYTVAAFSRRYLNPPSD